MQSWVMYLMLCEHLYICCVKHITIYALVAHLSMGLTPGRTEVFCVSWDVILVLCPVGTLHVVYMCLWAFSSEQQWLIKKKTEKRGFFIPTAVVYLYLSSSPGFFPKSWREKRAFPKSGFTYLLFEMAVAISLHWLQCLGSKALPRT